VDRPDWTKEELEEESIPAALMMQSPSMVDLKRQEELSKLRDDWKLYKLSDKFPEFTKIYDTIVGCLETNITKRWDTQMIYDNLSRVKERELSAHFKNEHILGN